MSYNPTADVDDLDFAQTPTTSNSYNTPAEVTQLAIAAGETKASATAPRALVAGFLAGAYIGFGALVATIGSAGMSTSNGLITLVTGVTFSLGLVLVVIAGADLLTGNMALVPLAVFAKRVTVGRLLANWLWVTIGNLAGALVVAWLFASQSGLFKSGSINFVRLGAIASGKGITEGHWEQFVRAIGCNWLVCLAVFIAMASTTVSGKILAIVFPITAFVALGFDHVVANMFFLPAAMMVHTGGLSLSDTVLNLVFAYLGNAVGAGVFVAGAYFYLFGRPARTVPSQGA